MKNIYITDEFQSSKKNGLGVFIKQLIKYLEVEEYTITHINTNSDDDELEIDNESKVKTFNIPKIMGYPFSQHPEILSYFFNLYIEDSADNIFILNHSPCEKLIENIKESFPLSKIVFVIHDFGWTMALDGDYEKMREILANKEDEEIKSKHHGIIKYYGQEIEMYSLVDKVVCLSEDAYNFLLKEYNQDKSKVAMIYNGLEDSYTPMTEEEKAKTRKEFNVEADEKIMVYSGRVNKIKGGTALLASYHGVLEKHPNARLVIMGSLSNLNLESGKKHNEIASRITFTGHINHDDIRKWYQIADVGLIPSYIEQCSYSVMEMMMHGLPIIASDGFGVRRMLEDGVNARTAKIETRENEDKYVENLTEAISEVLASNELQSKLKKASRDVFLSKYEVHHMKDKYKNLVESL